jgi:orotidine-5'-phosphate decarboxylase
MTFRSNIELTANKNNSRLCVGLDPQKEHLPPGFNVLEYNKAIIEATADLVCCYKPNLAFYEALGTTGYQILQKTIKHIPAGIPVIGDAKRGDIGNTAKAYAVSLFNQFGFDAVTLNPYMGFDSIEPFISYTNKGLFILCCTSNPGAKDLQMVKVMRTNLPLCELVAYKAVEWNKHGNIGLVIGATHPQQLSRIRQIANDLLLLIPGVGIQGGNLESAVRYGGRNIIISASRSILNASNGPDFALYSRKAAENLRKQINNELAKQNQG